MTPVFQEFEHDLKNGIVGDCQRACIASLLDLSLNEVPHFYQSVLNKGSCKHGTKEFNFQFEFEINNFLNSLGYQHLILRPIDFDLCSKDTGFKKVFHMIYGQTVVGTEHAVIGLNGNIYFDPYPNYGLENTLLLKDEDNRKHWLHALIIPTFGA